MNGYQKLDLQQDVNQVTSSSQQTQPVPFQVAKLPVEVLQIQDKFMKTIKKYHVISNQSRSNKQTS